MIRHSPYGSGHPYSPDTEQRFPVYPASGGELNLGVRTSHDINTVEVELEFDGKLTTKKLSQVQRSSRGQLSDGGHLASAQARKTRSVGGWSITLTIPHRAKRLRYRFTGISSHDTQTTRWFSVAISEWKPTTPEALEIQGLENRLVKNSIRVLDDGTNLRRLSFELRLQPGEHVSGFGERYDQTDHRGSSLDSVVFEQYKDQGKLRRTYFPMPFAHVVGKTGWGFWIQTSRRVWFDIAESKPDILGIEMELDCPSNQRPAVSISIYEGSPTDVLRQFLDDVGHPQELPRSVFGLWASGNEWNTQAEVLKQAELHKKHGIPISNLVIEAWSDESTFTAFRDAQYETKDDGSPHRLSDFTFPEDGAWPDPKGMVDKLHEDGISVHLWQIPLMRMRPHPTGQARADADYAIANDLLVKRETPSGGLLPYRNRGWWFPLALMPDLSFQECVSWWTEKRRYLIEEVGIDGFKTDGGEHAWGTDLVYADGTKGDVRNNEFPRYYAKAYCELLQSAGKAPMTFSRAGFTGSQSYGAFWAGDENSTWEAFRWSMIAGLSAASCGVVYWGWDIAGFSGPIPTPELYIRAMSASAFLPIMQYHSEFNHHKQPSQDRTPWNIAERHGDAEVIDDVRAIVELRQRLEDYLVSEAQKTIESSRPLMRPMFFEHPADRRVWEPIQWYCGDDLLVSPVLEENATTWEVYLPAGNWIYAHSGEAFEGGKYVSVDVSDRKLTPVFVLAERWEKVAQVFR